LHSLTAYVSASWLFFFDRIPDEEELLVGFFGGAWKRHAHATWVGIPLLGWVARRSDGALFS
jgi:protein-S-isoprenylcysteine O-methyltransferase Ste14